MNMARFSNAADWLSAGEAERLQEEADYRSDCRRDDAIEHELARKAMQAEQGKETK